MDASSSGTATTGTSVDDSIAQMEKSTADNIKLQNASTAMTTAVNSNKMINDAIIGVSNSGKETVQSLSQNAINSAQGTGRLIGS